MTIRTITPPLATQYGSDTTAQFAEVQDIQFTITYKPTGPGGAIEQWVKVRIIMEVWEGGASASEGAAPIRKDVFTYEVKPNDDAWPLTEINWNAIRDYVYNTIIADTENPSDDPQAYSRGTVFLD